MGNINFKFRTVFWNISFLRFGDLNKQSYFLKKATFSLNSTHRCNFNSFLSPNLSPENKNKMGDMCKVLNRKWPTFHNSFFTIKDFGCQVALCTNFARLRNIYHSCGRFIFYCHAQIANGTNTSLFHQDIFTFQVSEIGKKDCYNNNKANCKKKT